MIQRINTHSHEEWLALRRKYIGGSDAGAIAGMNPFTSAYSLWAEKTGKLPGFEGNLATEVGTALEDFVARKWSKEVGKRVFNPNYSMVNDKYPWAIANADRLIVGEAEGLECKTTSELNLKKFHGQEFPEQYYCQCVHYLAVTGRKRWHLAVLVGNREFLTYTLERDEDEITALMEMEKRFWYEHVLKDIPPAVDGSKSTAQAISALHPDSSDLEVDLSAYQIDLQNYFLLQDQAKDLENRMAEISNRIKAFMGDDGVGLCEGAKVSWKTQSRRIFDSKAFLSDFPQYAASNKYFKESSARVFRVTKKG